MPYLPRRACAPDAVAWWCDHSGILLKCCFDGTGSAKFELGAIAAPPSHRLERAVEFYIDQRRDIVLESLADQVGRLVNRLGALGGDAERTRQADKVDGGVDEFHPHIGVDLLSVAAQRMEALLEDAIGRIVEDYEHDRNAVVRRCP